MRWIKFKRLLPLLQRIQSHLVEKETFSAFRSSKYSRKIAFFSISFFSSDDQLSFPEWRPSFFFVFVYSNWHLGGQQDCQKRIDSHHDESAIWIWMTFEWPTAAQQTFGHNQTGRNGWKNFSEPCVVVQIPIQPYLDSRCGLCLIPLFAFAWEQYLHLVKPRWILYKLPRKQKLWQLSYLPTNPPTYLWHLFILNRMLGTYTHVMLCR